MNGWKTVKNNAPKASLKRLWPAAYVIYENVFKEEINIACKEGATIFCCAIDLDFRLSESWDWSQKITITLGDTSRCNLIVKINEKA